MKPRDPRTFEGLLQQKLEEHSAEPPPNLWAKIERESQASRLRFLAKKINIHLHGLNLAATILLLLIALFFWDRSTSSAPIDLPIPNIPARWQQQLNGKTDSLDSLQQLIFPHPLPSTTDEN